MSTIFLPQGQKPKLAFDSYEAHLNDVMNRHKKTVEKICDAEAVDQSEANMYALQKTVFNLQVQVEQLVSVIGAITQRMKGN